VTWYAVCEDRSWREETQDEMDAARVWTVSRDPEAPGWETDGGAEGYGLTRADAEFLAATANKAEVAAPVHDNLYAGVTAAVKARVAGYISRICSGTD
jgi:hypothetical protein